MSPTPLSMWFSQRCTKGAKLYFFVWWFRLQLFLSHRWLKDCSKITTIRPMLTYGWTVKEPCYIHTILDRNCSPAITSSNPQLMPAASRARQLREVQLCFIKRGHPSGQKHSPHSFHWINETLLPYGFHSVCLSERVRVIQQHKPDRQ